jgi:GntR family transcriptional regulator, transcriptional repressor for pyruvate dehydrogenase complex
LASGKSTIDAAAAALREIVLDAAPGALLGSEDALVARLGVSRSTVRQVARLLEREGLLLVRRGINGGYYGARPTIGTIETTVSAYLETLDMDTRDLTTVASALWVEVMRRAAGAPQTASAPMIETMRRKLDRLKPACSFSDISKIEQEFQRAVFDLVNSRYIELIFQINTAFAQRRFTAPSLYDDTEAHRRFIQEWRQVKRLELSAIEDGDADLAVMVARHMRNVWHKRLWDVESPAGEQG